MPVISPAPVFRWFVPAQSGTGLVPAAGYKAKWYSAGTTTAKAIYDANNTIYPSPSNTAVLNAEGYAAIRLGDGMYKLVVTDPNDNPVYTQDNIQGGGSFSSGIVATVANDLPGVDTGNFPFVFCMGYYAIGDGGHGFFWNTASSNPPDGGYTIASTFDGTRRWFRVPDEDGDVRAASFGYIGTKSGNLSTQLTNACAYTFSTGKRLIIGSGTTAKIGTSGQPFQLYTFDIHFEGTATLTADTGVTVLQFPVTGKVSGSDYPHFSGFTTISFPSDLLIMPSPVWFGASTSTDNTTAFAKWIAASGGNAAFVLPPGVWPYANPLTFPYPAKPMLLWGTIGSGGNAIPPGVYFPDGSRFRFGTLKLKDGQTISSSASYVELVGGLRTTLDLITGTAITAGGDITSSGSLFASHNAQIGLDGAAGGTFLFRAGLSSNYGRCPGRLYKFAQIAGAALQSYTVVGSTVQNAGDEILFEAAGTMSASATDVTFTLLLGGSVTLASLLLPLSLETPTTTATKWIIRAKIICIDTTHSLVSATIITDHGSALDSGLITTNCDYRSVTHSSNAWTANQSIGLSSGGAHAPTQNMMTVDFYPAP